MGAYSRLQRNLSVAKQLFQIKQTIYSSNGLNLSTLFDKATEFLQKQDKRESLESLGEEIHFSLNLQAQIQKSIQQVSKQEKALSDTLSGNDTYQKPFVTAIRQLKQCAQQCKQSEMALQQSYDAKLASDIHAVYKNVGEITSKRATAKEQLAVLREKRNQFEAAHSNLMKQNVENNTIIQKLEATIDRTVQAKALMISLQETYFNKLPENMLSNTTNLKILNTAVSGLVKNIYGISFELLASCATSKTFLSTLNAANQTAITDKIKAFYTELQIYTKKPSYSLKRSLKNNAARLDKQLKQLQQQCDKYTSQEDRFTQTATQLNQQLRERQLLKKELEATGEKLEKCIQEIQTTHRQFKFADTQLGNLEKARQESQARFDEITSLSIESKEMLSGLNGEVMELEVDPHSLKRSIEDYLGKLQTAQCKFNGLKLNKFLLSDVQKSALPSIGRALTTGSRQFQLFKQQFNNIEEALNEKGGIHQKAKRLLQQLRQADADLAALDFTDKPNVTAKGFKDALNLFIDYKTRISTINHAFEILLGRAERLHQKVRNNCITDNPLRSNSANPPTQEILSKVRQVLNTFQTDTSAYSKAKTAIQNQYDGYTERADFADKYKSALQEFLVFRNHYHKYSDILRTCLEYLILGFYTSDKVKCTRLINNMTSSLEDYVASDDANKLSSLTCNIGKLGLFKLPSNPSTMKINCRLNEICEELSQPLQK